MRLPWVELEVWSEEKLNHVLKTDGDKLFIDLLINKVFSKQILSWNLKWIFVWTGDWYGNFLVEH